MRIFSFDISDPVVDRFDAMEAGLRGKMTHNVVQSMAMDAKQTFRKANAAVFVPKTSSWQKSIWFKMGISDYSKTATLRGGPLANIYEYNGAFNDPGVNEKSALSNINNPRRGGAPVFVTRKAIQLKPRPWFWATKAAWESRQGPSTAAIWRLNEELRKLGLETEEGVTIPEGLR